MVASDKQMAQLAFGMLAVSALEDPSSPSGLESLQQQLQSALTGALAHHPADTQQVECLLEVTGASNRTSVLVHDAAKAAQRAGCQHLGIRQVSFAESD